MSRAEQSRAEQSRAEQSRAEQSRAEQSRAEQSRAEAGATRLDGPDILRFIALLTVVCLHVQMWSFQGISDCFSLNRYLYDCIGRFSLICIPIFGLLSGYLLVYHEIHYRKLLPMWLMVYFYSICGELIAVVFGYQKHVYWYAFFPILRCRWWYITAYFILFLFLKILNPHLKKTDIPHCVLYTFLMLFILTSNPFSPSLTSVLGGGFSVFKLMGLYVLGACIRRFYDDNTLCNRFSVFFRKIKYFYFWKFLLLIFVIFYLIFMYLPYGVPKIPRRFYDFLTADFYAPFNLGIAIILFLLFCKKTVSKFRPMLKIFSPVALDVYIIHMHPCLAALVFCSYYRLDMTHASIWQFISYFCIRVAAIIGICTGIAWARKYLFDLLHVSEYCNQLSNKAVAWINSKIFIADSQGNL